MATKHNLDSQDPHYKEGRRMAVELKLDRVLAEARTSAVERKPPVTQPPLECSLSSNVEVPLTVPSRKLNIQEEFDFRLKPRDRIELLNVQSYSQNEVQLEQVAPIHLTIGLTMSVVHPVYISPMDSYPLLIGKDLLDCFEPLLDFKQLKIWAQVREPLPPQSPRSPDTDCQVTEVMGSLTTSRGNAPSHDPGSRSLLCAFQLAKDLGSDSPQVRADLQLNDVTTTDIILALWADNSAISLTLFDALKRHTPNIPIANKRTRFSLDPCLSTLVTAKSICALNLKWNNRCLTHYFLILPDLPHDVYIGADILIQLRAHVDLINEVIWAPMTSLPPTVPVKLENLASVQTIPEAWDGLD
ncbi:hypothetical protein QQF64_034259 [Cirrhinus molitorella]|uniref:Uncharacterized protein n=1 Tax=Cirrhinus molitorella TaxID=172907 RepID=A0ABR3MWB9_9TELE